MKEGGGTFVVVPTYNERENIRQLVEEIKEAKLTGLTLLFVDDSSPDGTENAIREMAAREPWVKVVVRGGKMGIGSAYQDGFQAAKAFSPEIFVEMDADLQHPPSSIVTLVEAVKQGAGVAVASRYITGGSAEGWTFWRRLVSRGANAYARFLLRLPVKDATSGFRAYSKEAAEELMRARLPAKGFEFQVATLQLLKAKVKIVEVPYSFSARASGRSKLGTLDMLRFFFLVLWLAIR
jgi:dolichol-phosphate mannosyltransferase